MLNTIIETITRPAFLGAIFSTISIIMLGYWLRKSNKVDDNATKVLTNILMTLALPALAFNAFMTPINPATFEVGLNTFIFGFTAYILLIVGTLLFTLKYKGDKLDVMRALIIFGSTTFFGIPIISSFLGSKGVLFANLFNIAYRMFLYTYCFILISKLKLEKKNLKNIFLNPIIIATLLGFFIWILQDYLPQVTVEGETVAFLRLDVTAPWLMQALRALSGLASPLAWLAIGMTLARISLKDATKDKDVWIYAFFKLLVVPAVMLGIMLLITVTNILSLNYYAIAAIVIMMATPPATVAVSFCINFNKEELFASNASLLTTVLAVIAIIFWIIVVAVMYNAGVF